MAEYKTFYTVWFDMNNNPHIVDARAKVTAKQVRLEEYTRGFAHIIYPRDKINRLGVAETPGQAIELAISSNKGISANLALRLNRSRQKVAKLKALRGIAIQEDTNDPPE